MTYPSRLTGLETSRREYGEQADRIAAFFMAGDPLADEAVRALGTLPAARQKALVSRALEQGIDAVPDAPAAVQALFRQVEHVPFWVDFERCNRGGAVFFRKGALAGVALGFGALARAYCSAGGNKPLTFTRELIDRAPQRVAETSHYVRTVSQPEGLRPGRPGFVASIKVRLMHARVRLGLMRSPRWRSEAWGVPINQADMAITALLFSHGMTEGVRRLGGRVTAQEEADQLHLWRYAGYLLGVEEELLCSSAEEARRMAALINAIDAGPDEDSRRLLAAMLAPENFRARLGDPTLASAVRTCYLGACRALLGEHAEAAGLPPGRHDIAFRALVRPTLKLISHTVPFMPGSNEKLMGLGHAYWERFSMPREEDEPPGIELTEHV